MAKWLKVLAAPKFLRVFLQPFLPLLQLIIVGGGHIRRPLKVMGEAAGFVVIVADFSRRPDLTRQYSVARPSIGAAGFSFQFI